MSVQFELACTTVHASSNLFFALVIYIGQSSEKGSFGHHLHTFNAGTAPVSTLELQFMCNRVWTGFMSTNVFSQSLWKELTEYGTLGTPSCLPRVSTWNLRFAHSLIDHWSVIDYAFIDYVFLKKSFVAESICIRVYENSNAPLMNVLKPVPKVSLMSERKIHKIGHYILQVCLRCPNYLKSVTIYLNRSITVSN